MHSEILYVPEYISIYLPQTQYSSPIGGATGAALKSAVDQMTTPIENETKNDLIIALDEKTKNVLSLSLLFEMKKQLKSISKISYCENDSLNCDAEMVLVVNKYGYKYGYPDIILDAYIVLNPPFKLIVDNIGSLKFTDEEEHEIVWKYSLSIKKYKKQIKGIKSLLEYINNPANIEKPIYESAKILSENICKTMQ